MAVAVPTRSNAAEGTSAQPAASQAGPAPATLKEAGAWIDENLRQKPPFKDDSFEATADAKCPDTFPSKLPEPENSTEVVLDLLWKEFAIGCVGYAVNIEPEALGAGRRNIRGDILADVKATGCAAGADCDLSNFPFGKYLQKWRALGENSAKRADAGGAGDATIAVGHFQAAWAEVYPGHQPSSAPIGPADEATELIGDHLWFQFTLGVLSVVDRVFDEEVVREGRAHSRYYVNLNVFKRGVTDGNSAPDYSKWNFDTVGECARRAGAHASRKAGEAGSPSISKKHFHKAWCQTSESVKRLARLQGKNWGDMAQGCG